MRATSVAPRIASVVLVLLGAAIWVVGAGAAAQSRTALAPGAGRLLIAGPALLDPNFARTVVLLLDFDEDGALGLILNRRSRLTVRSVLPEVDELRARADRLYLGGPVARDRLLVLLRRERPSADTREVIAGVRAGTDLGVLRESLRSGVEFRAYAGYAGWGPGQLEREIERGDWLVAPGTAENVFATPTSGLWERLIERNAGTWVRRERSPAPRAGAA